MNYENKESPWTFAPSVSWRSANSEELNQFLRQNFPNRKANQYPDTIELFTATLPFYQQHQLYCLRSEIDGDFRHAFFLINAKKVFALDGESPPIHMANSVENLQLTEVTAAAYLRFFCSFTHGELGPFQILENLDEVHFPSSENKVVQAKYDKSAALIKQAIKHVNIVKITEETTVKFQTDITICYGDIVFKAQMEIWPNGMVEMLDDNPLTSDLPEDAITKIPKLLYIEQVVPYSKLGKNNNNKKLSDLDLDSDGDINSDSPSTNAAQNTLIFKLDREVTRCFIAILFRFAIENSEKNTLLTTFNKTSSAKDMVEDFANFVSQHGPVVVVESDIPYVEELIGEIIVDEGNNKSFQVVRYKLGHQINQFNNNTLVLISGQTLSKAKVEDRLDFEHLAYGISMSDVSVLITCARFADLPEALRNVADVRIKLPEMNDILFRHLFIKIFNSSLPANWRKSGVNWIRYLVATDFHQPAKLGMKGSEALRYLRSRVNARLRQVESSNGPSLKDLHGMAEARQIAEDLIADIQSALRGQLPWSAVDRGMLLAGPPGTGKTTLAKAIAKECGVRFISASAAEWQSAGHLGDYLREMRSSFAEARRYAPSIIFIDEFDSFGNRASFSGNMGQYSTEVVNALLEQIQGFESKSPVFVLAATNHPEKVDPALRRAGRLDKVVQIPYPNVDALTAIFTYYLSNQQVTGKQSDDIDTKTLGALAFGLTGADVEFFVRGAARRARKEQKPLSQQHLTDEVTGKSRIQHSTGRLNTAEMHQVAAHEAGHALAKVLSSEPNITFVSILPRDNGSLGFVASMPTSRTMHTRKQYQEQLQIILAGRAAEELVFGQDHISGGAGGYSQNSDLAVATRLVTSLVCHLALGKNASLAWVDSPDSHQLLEITQMLNENYAAILAKLEANRSQLDKLSNALVERQELSGAEIAALLKSD